MTQAAVSYAAVLLSLSPSEEAVSEAQERFALCPALGDSLSNPTISKAEKFAVIEKLFPKALQSFLKLVCQNGQIDSIQEIFREYEVLRRQQRQCAHAVLEYVTPLTQAQVSAMERMICAKTGKDAVELEMRQNKDLLGGFILHIGDDTYDRSMRATIRNMRKSLTRR